jgi:arylsulfatase A-like enzyme
MKKLPLGYVPNIIYIKLDDFRVPDGFFAQAMPYLNSLANKTLFYPNAVCTVPLCAPNRGVSFTGLHAQRNGIMNNGDGADTNWANTWANAVRKQGVKTLLYGKFMNEWAKNGKWGKITDLPFGFGHFEGTAGATNYYNYDTCVNGIISSFGATAADYCTDAEVSNTGATLGIVPALTTIEPPFALYWGCKASHSDENDLAIPAPRHTSVPMIPWTPVKFDPEPNGQQPPWYYDNRADQWSAAERETFKTRQIESYRAALSADEAIQSIVTALTARGLDSTTWLFIDVDNGFAGGMHGNDQKGTIFEECINSGLRVIYLGGGISGTRPQRVSALDMAPTICDLMGASMPVQGHGMSFAHTFASATSPHRRESFVNSLKEGQGNPLVEGLRGLNYTVGRNSLGSEYYGATWVWPDVDQQITTRPMSPDQRSAIDVIKKFI